MLLSNAAVSLIAQHLRISSVPRGDFCLGMLEKVPHLLPCKDSPEGCLLGVVLELRPESKAMWVVLASFCRLECCRRAESAVSVTVYS